MIDFLFSFSDEYFYSNNLANWKDLVAGSEIIITSDESKYIVVKNDIIQHNKKFTVKNKNTISINGNVRGIVLDGDALNCEFETYELVIINEIVNGGNNYKVGDILNIEAGTFFNKSYDKKESAQLLVKSVNTIGCITEVEIINKGVFLSNFNQLNAVGDNGQEVIFTVIMRKAKNKIKLLLSINDCIYQEKETDIIVEEDISTDFKQGEFSLSRHRITVNKKIDKNYSYQPFFLVEEQTPYLKLPLAKSNNIQNLYNQAILTIDSKLQEIDNKLRFNAGQ